MRSRDRLAEFRQRCAGQAAAPRLYGETTEPCEGGTQRAGEGEGEGAAALAAVQPALHRVLLQVESVRGWLLRLEQNARLVPALAGDDLAAAHGAQEQLESVTAESNLLGAQVCAALRRLGEDGVRDPSGDAGAGVARRVARLHAAAWRARARDALAAHERALSAARDTRLAILRKQIQLTNMAVSDEECEELLDSGNVAIFVDNVAAQTAAAREALRAAEARRAELARVEAALRDVRDLFQQLAELVHHQQESIDTIEYLSAQASQRVEGGGRELLKGSVTRRKTRKKKLSLILCVTTGAAIVLIVLLLT